MLNDSNKDRVRSVLNDLLSGGSSFTAFDVTRLLRHQGTKIRHTGLGNVREFVHELWDTQDPIFPVSYERTLANLSFGTCFVYHLMTVDPEEDYDPDKLDPSKTSSGGTPPVHVVPPTIPVSKGDGAIHADKRGRLWVPAAAVRSIQLEPGDSAAVFPSGTHLHIVDANNLTALGSISKIKLYRVNKNGEVELPKRTLSQVFAVKQFQVKYENDLDGSGQHGLVVTVG